MFLESYSWSQDSISHFSSCFFYEEAFLDEDSHPPSCLDLYMSLRNRPVADTEPNVHENNIPLVMSDLWELILFFTFTADPMPCKTRPFRIGTISEHEVVHLVEDWGPNFVWPLTPKVKMKIILSALGSQSHGKKLWSGGLLGYTFTCRVVSRAWQIGPNPLKTFPQCTAVERYL